MKVRLIAFFLVLSISVTAQFQAPNYDGISKVIKDKASTYFYPELLSRYHDNDTALSTQHYRILYYGYIYHENYDPYSLPLQFDSLNNILKKEIFTPNDYQELIEMEKRILMKFPFNLREVSLLAKAYEETGQMELAAAMHDKFRKITEAILSTGDGKTKETAMHVIMNSHEYDILHYLGLEYNNETAQTESTYELLSVKPNKYNLEGIFFNIKKMFEHEARILEK